MVNVVAHLAAVEGRHGRFWWGLGTGGTPDHGALQVWKPPDAGVFSGRPEGGGPRREDGGERDQGLRPLDVEVWRRLECQFDDDSQGAEGTEGGAEEEKVGRGTTADGLAIGEEEGSGGDGLREEAVAETGAVGAGADCAGNGLHVDAAEIGKSETSRGEELVEVVQRETGLEAHLAGSVVDIVLENGAEVVEIDHPRGCAGEIGWGVAIADDDEALATASGEGDDLLDLGEGFGLEVEFRARIKGAGPGIVEMGCLVAEGDGGIEAVKLGLDLGRESHCKEGNGDREERRWRAEEKVWKG